MLSTTLSLLKGRLLALKSVKMNTNCDLKPWQKYALMYRSGQEDIYNSTIAKIEGMKRQLISCMDQDTKESRIALMAPFLSIVNQDHHCSSLDIDNSPFVSLDMVVITSEKIMKEDAAFSKAISEIFEDQEEEADIVLMLCLIQEKNKQNSKWKKFFEKASRNTGDQVELKEMYESMIPEFAEAYPDIFDLERFDFKSFVWADNILNNYSIDGPLAIVPL
ncbi:hypothetical protein BY458DRAFT_536883 [Sporodiniella umbellata]|nr:hypothetical protein BY458DRAFT_536883 [Sporodiniella umbellata]